MSKILLSFALIFSMASMAYAQSGKLFTVDKELSSSMIHHLYQDHRGIVWIATENGLNRYDGAKFTYFKHDKEKSNSLLSDCVKVINEDKNGNILVGGLYGLQLYNVSVDTFQNVPLMLVDGGIFNAHVVSIQKRKNGEIIIGTSGHGMFSLKEEADGYKAYQDTVAIKNHANMLNVVYEDTAQNIWMGTNNCGLLKMSMDGKLKSYLANSVIACMCQDKDGNLFVGTLDRGLFRYESMSDTFVPLISELSITSLKVNKNNHLLIGTDGFGLKMYDIQNKCFINENLNIPFFDFSVSKIHTILEDEDGNLWLGLYQKGVLYLPNIVNHFHYIGYKSTSNTIGSACVMSVCRDKNGLLWIGTDSDGVYAINKAGKRVYHYDRNNSNVPQVTMVICEDSKGNIWLGAYMGGLCKLNRHTGHCEYVELKDASGDPVKNIYSIVEDARQVLWIGTMGDGLYGMDLNTGKTEVYQFNGDYNSLLNVLVNDCVSCLHVSRRNRLYIGTYFGVVCLDLEKRSFTSTYVVNRLLENTVIYALYEDRRGDIWAGTADGLFCVDAYTHAITSYSTKDGLCSNMICGIVGDSSDCLWISTNYGISCFDKKARVFTNYYANDGLYGNEYSKGALWKDADGSLGFGGVNGIVAFNPEDIKMPVKKLDMYITDFYVHDKAVYKGMKSGSRTIIDTTVTEAHDFHLAYIDNSFSIEFSAMEFSNPERITFLYSVNHENWMSLQQGVNRLSFSDLAPGEYNFRVRAKDFEVYSPVKEILITVYPPLYRSIWAKMLYVLLLIGIVYLVLIQIRHRYRVRQQLMEQAHARDINEAKLQFFINVSHEIRTPMSLIISPLQKLMAIDRDEARYKLYKLINRNAGRILDLVNQLMDVRKIDKGQMVLKFRELDMVDFLKNLVAAFKYQASEKDIAYTLHTELESLPVWVDSKHFDKIVLNLLSNAFKFTPEHGKIDVSLRCDESNYEIVISDDGQAIDDDKIERIFERFYQIDSQNNTSGTGVGLHLTRSLVEMHHGRVWAENYPDGHGCRFIVRLPLGNAHLRPDEMDDSKDETVFPLPKIEEPLMMDEKNVSYKRTKYRLLLVEDDEEIRKYLSDELGESYHISECRNGKEALSLLLQNKVDIVVSDIMMPEMDGLTLCRKIKQNINVNHIPVILLTAKTREEDNLEGLSVGADAYVTKPFSIEIVKKTVENLVKGRESLKTNFSGNQIQESKLEKLQLASADEKLLDRVMESINRNLGDPNFSVEMLSSEVGLSRVHLHRKMRELTNQSTQGLIRSVRLKQAAKLIAEGKHHSINEIATAVGFASFTNFSTVFKEFYGVSPSEYRKNSDG